MMSGPGRTPEGKPEWLLPQTGRHYLGQPDGHRATEPATRKAANGRDDVRVHHGFLGREHREFGHRAVLGVAIWKGCRWRRVPSGR